MRNLIDSSIGRLRLNGYAEGITFIILLFIALPLKYFNSSPDLFRLVSWIHGILLIQFLHQSFVVKEEENFPSLFLLIALIAAFLPFGTFIFDRWLKKQQTQGI